MTHLKRENIHAKLFHRWCLYHVSSQTVGGCLWSHLDGISGQQLWDFDFFLVEVESSLSIMDRDQNSHLLYHLPFWCHPPLSSQTLPFLPCCQCVGLSYHQKTAHIFCSQPSTLFLGMVLVVQLWNLLWLLRVCTEPTEAWFHITFVHVAISCLVFRNFFVCEA